MFSNLRAKLTPEKIASDLKTVLARAHWTVELDGKSIHVEPRGTLEVVARSCHAYDQQIGFGDHFRVLVAVGGVDEVKNGIVQPDLCFATIWYDMKLSPITIDFSSTMP